MMLRVHMHNLGGDKYGVLLENRCVFDVAALE